MRHKIYKSYLYYIITLDVNATKATMQEDRNFQMHLAGFLCRRSAEDQVRTTNARLPLPPEAGGHVSLQRPEECNQT